MEVEDIIFVVKELNLLCTVLRNIFHHGGAPEKRIITYYHFVIDKDSVKYNISSYHFFIAKKYTNRNTTTIITITMRMIIGVSIPDSSPLSPLSLDALEVVNVNV